MYIEAMELLRPTDVPVARALAGLADGNPFLPSRVEAERAALGRAFVPTAEVWHAEATLEGLNPNLPKLAARAEVLAGDLRERLAEGAAASPEALSIYEGLVRYVLYARNEAEFLKLIHRAEAGKKTTGRVAAWPGFARDFAFFVEPADRAGLVLPGGQDAAGLFAWGFQVRRAFHHTYRQISGGSLPAARLRAAVWESIFTHDFPAPSASLKVSG